MGRQKSKITNIKIKSLHVQEVIVKLLYFIAVQRAGPGMPRDESPKLEGRKIYLKNEIFSAIDFYF
jgi:hypothetical protein